MSACSEISAGAAVRASAISVASPNDCGGVGYLLCPASVAGPNKSTTKAVFMTVSSWRVYRTQLDPSAVLEMWTALGDLPRFGEISSANEEEAADACSVYRSHRTA